jgi:hypothetical protein
MNKQNSVSAIKVISKHRFLAWVPKYRNKSQKFKQDLNTNEWLCPVGLPSDQKKITTHIHEPISNIKKRRKFTHLKLFNTKIKFDVGFKNGFISWKLQMTQKESSIYYFKK